MSSIQIEFLQDYKSIPKGFGFTVNSFDDFPTTFVDEDITKDNLYSLLNLEIIDILLSPNELQGIHCDSIYIDECVNEEEDEEEEESIEDRAKYFLHYSHGTNKSYEFYYGKRYKELYLFNGELSVVDAYVVDNIAARSLISTNSILPEGLNYSEFVNYIGKGYNISMEVPTINFVELYADYIQLVK